MWSQRSIHHTGVLGAGQVWNYHLIEQPEVVYRLGCEWNAQLGGSKFGLPVSGWIRTERVSAVVVSYGYGWNKADC
eukprot:COSAG01_NODE_277_length_19582_cov_28.126726_7_plen_76_part_00